MSIRVVHGANEELCEAQGKTVGAIRRALSDAFNIPDVAVSLVGGEEVTDSHVIGDGECLEFVKVHGEKGLGPLLTPEELQVKLQIDAQQYDELMSLGLPNLRFGDGSVRHSDVAVESFLHRLALQQHQETTTESFDDRVLAALNQIAIRLPNLAGPPMTVEQVAEFASVSTKTVYRWVGNGKMKPKADGARPLLFERSEVEKTLSQAAGS